MRLLTVGGTPLEAMQRYEPMCCLVTRWKVSVELSTTATVQTIGEINLCTVCWLGPTSQSIVV